MEQSKVHRSRAAQEAQQEQKRKELVEDARIHRERTSKVSSSPSALQTVDEPIVTTPSKPVRKPAKKSTTKKVVKK